MSYRWHKVNGEWESFSWRKFCIAAVLGHGVFFLGWILVSCLVVGRWNHRIFEGAACAIVGLIVMVSWERFRSTESPDFASEPTATLDGKTESPIDAIDLSVVRHIASTAASRVFTVIELFHVYDVDRKTGHGIHARPPWYTLWLYPGSFLDDDEDGASGPDSEEWGNAHATQLDGRWYEYCNAHAAADRVAAALRQAGYETHIDVMADD